MLKCILIICLMSLYYTQNMGTAITYRYNDCSPDPDWRGFDFYNGECHLMWNVNVVMGSRKIICNSTHTIYRLCGGRECARNCVDYVDVNTCRTSTIHYCGGRPRPDLSKHGHVYIRYHDEKCEGRFNPIDYSNHTFCRRGTRDGSYLFENKGDKVEVSVYYSRNDCRGNGQVQMVNFGQCVHVPVIGYVKFLNPKNFNKD